MQKNEIVEFLNKIDAYITGTFKALTEKKFELKIIGKSALLLAGLTASVGTVDIDSLGIDGQTPSDVYGKIMENLKEEFGRTRISINDYYLEFVPPALVFLPQFPKWVLLGENYESLTVHYLEAHYVVASKLFSAFTIPPRKKDKQDIVTALDQKLVNFQKVVNIADEIFEFHSMGCEI